MNNLTISYNDKIVINGMDLELKKNTITAIIGESGTGKTSLGLSLMGLNKGRVTGEIIVNGDNILEYSSDRLNDYKWNTASIVFQNTGEILNPTVKIIDQVIEPMIEHKFCSKKEARNRAFGLLLQVGLDEVYYNVYPTQLSGGQVQKVLVAMALANDPKILILDEPTSALDPLAKNDMMNLIKDISKDKVILIITHDFSVAKTLAEDIVVLYGGHIVEKGVADDILSNPLHPYTRGLLRSFPNMTTTKDLQGIRGKICFNSEGCPFANRCNQCTDICYKQKPQLEYIKGRYISCNRKGIICLLEGKNVSKSYKKVSILKNINFNLYEGETLAVVGESGSGKTTLVKCIMGLEKTNEGQLFYNEEELIKHSKEFYKQVQVVYQNPQSSINKKFSVYKAIKEPLDIHSIGNEETKREKVLEVLNEVHLPTDKEFLNSYPYQLSGGECQRVAIARALILKPKLLIADEATSALDVSVQAKIMRLFMDLQVHRGLTMIFVTHDIALARKVSDKIIVLKQGKIVESGCSSIITSIPTHSYTKKLIQCAPQIL
jgi:peptide/nickel transport system ATP-binding protein